ncbi:MAG: hypothetical protein KIS95_14260 [Anaerolineae bacterium]|uniref:hypothetical protein n=1 Tax=Promineifilum sp. TaxID=2664178 RepID=UPI001DF35DF1|nr:hypothetical protein [Anaerolineales bacterium]MCB8934805.1 hypothetical protein [Promineifilum sp.]MCO5181279.1 hypothetical protein [Promineifilum sp.]MCW5848393.1 hypothetical protein [Anaerolineae bacterium]
MATSPSDSFVLLLVIAARLLIPLLIPAYPLPGIIAALVLDAVDQTLFQTFTHLPLDGYQSYDKALDIYYLSIAYISTLRNWTNHFAFQVGRFLFYYRLAGVALFELSGWRVLLFIFPNTFEYFFIWYETVVLWRNPRRLPRAAVVGAAATIWLIIKLPQEFWLHIARLDLTDVLKTALFGAPPETTWGVLFQALPGVFIGAVVASVALIGGLAWLAGRRLPRPESSLSAEARLRSLGGERLRAARVGWAARVFDRDLVEKVGLVSLLVVIFAQALPGGAAISPLPMAVAAALVIILNTGVSHWLARRGVGWRNALGQFIVMTAANLTIAAAFQVLPGARDLDDAAVAFFVLLLSLIVTLFDRFTEIHMARFHRGGESTDERVRL